MFLRTFWEPDRGIGPGFAHLPFEGTGSRTSGSKQVGGREIRVHIHLRRPKASRPPKQSQSGVRSPESGVGSRNPPPCGGGPSARAVRAAARRWRAYGITFCVAKLGVRGNTLGCSPTFSGLRNPEIAPRKMKPWLKPLLVGTCIIPEFLRRCEVDFVQPYYFCPFHAPYFPRSKSEPDPGGVLSQQTATYLAVAKTNDERLGTRTKLKF